MTLGPATALPSPEGSQYLVEMETADHLLVLNLSGLALYPRYLLGQELETTKEEVRQRSRYCIYGLQYIYLRAVCTGSFH